MISKNPVWSKICGTISCRIRLIANFALKFAVFVTMATGVSLSNYWPVTITFKQADPQNPLLGASLWVISLTYAEL